MPQPLKTTLLALSALAFAAQAQARGVETTITEPLATAVKVEVVLSEDMAYRANNLPKKLSDRGGSSRLNSGFGNNGYYGEKSLNDLAATIQRRTADRLTRKGVSVSDAAPTVLRVTIVDAKPNRPTFGQLSREAGLSYQSIAVGGAEFSAELIAAGGRSLGTIDYDWYETDIRDARYGSTWSDAKRAAGRFGSKAAKILSQGGNS